MNPTTPERPAAPTPVSSKLKRSARIPVQTKYWAATISSLHQLNQFLTSPQTAAMHGGFEGLYLEPFEDERQVLYQLEIIFVRPITAPTLDIRGVWEPIDEITPGDLRITGDDEDISSDDSTSIEDMDPTGKKLKKD